MINEKDYSLSFEAVDGRREFLSPYIGFLHTFISFLRFQWCETSDLPLQIIDVGGGVGGFTLALHERLPNALFHIFEPHYECWPYLEHNIKHLPHINIHRHPVMSKRGEVELSYPKEFVRIGNYSAYGDGISPTRVVGYPLDEVVKGQVQVLKIDVEGAEYDVIQGALGIIKEYRPFIYIEIKDIHLQRAGHSEAELIKYIISLGYEKPFHVSANDFVFEPKQ